MAHVQKYGNMSPNQHFPHAIQAPSHSQTLHHVANDPLSHHLLGKKKKKKHSCLESSPCPPKRGHGGRELEGTCVCPGLLTQPVSSLLPVLCSSPLPSSPGTAPKLPLSQTPCSGLISPSRGRYGQPSIPSLLFF